MPTTKDLSLIAILLVALALDGMMEAQETESSQRNYCEMIALWEKNVARGIAPEQRAGWPPYNGRKQCETEE